MLLSKWFVFRKDQKATTSKKLTIIIKIDVESHECEAFGGSKEVFDENSNYFIPFIFMEWFNLFKGQKYGPPEHCAGNKLAEMLHSKGYM